ncbi:MAG: ASCH domain-containing protein [Bacilli bacterium]|nr:ASCH domain-containing protein [Bacilli bacterium]
MKVISLTEPFATLISTGIKTIETRSWKTNYRGKLYIHASLTKIPKIYKNNQELMSLIDEKKLNFGYIICSCVLVDCIEMTDEFIENIKKDFPNEYTTGIYARGRYAWILKNIEPIDEPIKAKGHLGIWNFE